MSTTSSSNYERNEYMFGSPIQFPMPYMAPPLMGGSTVSAGVSAVPLPVVSSIGELGGILVSVSLIIIFAYLNLFDASGLMDSTLKDLLVAVSLSLSVVFSIVVLYTSLQIVGYI